MALRAHIRGPPDNILNSVDARDPKTLECTKPGLFVGVAASSNKHGQCYELAIETTQSDVAINVPPKELIPLEYVTFSSEEDIFDVPTVPVNVAGVIEIIFKKKRKEHVNPEELPYVKE